MLKKIIPALILAVATTVAHAAPTSTMSAEDAKSALSQGVSMLNSMSDAQLKDMMLNAAAQAEKKGQAADAIKFRQIAANPSLRSDAASVLNSKLQDASTNGIGFIAYLFIGFTYGGLCYAPEHTASGGYAIDWPCVLPWTIISVLTLDGNTASEK